MTYLGTLSAGIHPDPLRDIQLHAGIDTIELHCPKLDLPRGTPKMLQQLQREGAKSKIRNNWGKDGVILNRTLCFAHASITSDTLELIEKIREKLGTTVTRFDLALVVDGADPDEADKWIGRAVTLKWGKIGSEDVGESRYVKPARAARNLIIYGDKAKQWLTGHSEKVLQIELRFRKPFPKWISLERVTDLQNLDVRELFARSIRLKRTWTEFEKIIEREKDDRPDYDRKTRMTSFVKRFDLAVDERIEPEAFTRLIPERLHVRSHVFFG
ncbi:hypothetical protein [Mesorhizobium argentiipisi]|uniref:Uncharacterized protein n=1 Tax=Mesorhizobium argentiipisi TaxID=3015175 RepID=A0ABU8KH49_9HYPH